MGTYLIRRLLLLIPTLWLVTVFVFIVVRFIPGSIIELMVLEMSGEWGQQDVEVAIERLRHNMGLDVPIHIQYGHWVSKAFQGDLGNSLWTNEPIARELFGRLPVSIELGIFAITTALLIAFPVGIYSAMRQDTLGDYTSRTLAILALSIPAFWVAILVVVYPSIWWSWAPPLEYIPPTEDLVGNYFQFLIPGSIMGLYMFGTTLRMIRTMMLEVLRQDYIRTAWAKGLSERTVIFRHALKNALIPIVTIVGMQLPILIGGSIVIESIFVLPGVGRYMIEAISQRDYPVITAINLFFAVSMLTANLLVDISYAYLDPRIKYK